MNLDIDELAALTALLQDGAMTTNEPGNASALEKVQGISFTLDFSTRELACIEGLVSSIGPNDQLHPGTVQLIKKLRREGMRRLLLERYRASPHLTRTQFVEEWADKLGISMDRVLEVMGL